MWALFPREKLGSPSRTQCNTWAVHFWSMGRLQPGYLWHNAGSFCSSRWASPYSRTHPRHSGSPSSQIVAPWTSFLPWWPTGTRLWGHEVHLEQPERQENGASWGRGRCGAREKERQRKKFRHYLHVICIWRGRGSPACTVCRMRIDTQSRCPWSGPAPPSLRCRRTSEGSRPHQPSSPRWSGAADGRSGQTVPRPPAALPLGHRCRDTRHWGVPQAPV